MIRSYFQLSKYDGEMSRLKSTPRYRSRSFVQGFLKLMYCTLDLTNAGLITITDISGVGRVGQGSGAGQFRFLRTTACGRDGSNFLTSSVPTISSTLGIVLGSGTTAISPTDYSLATQIAEGTSSGKLEHFPSSGWTLSVSNPTGSFKLERLFRNSSGGNVTINEAGVYASHMNNTLYGICIIRDLVSPAVVLANGEYLRAIYTITVTA